jgi:transposase-like protein
MYARGMSTREITGHLREMYGIDVSPHLTIVCVNCKVTLFQTG